MRADRTTVWSALIDPAVLVRTIPGCRRLEALGDDAYAMTISAGVGSITGVYDGRVQLSDQQQPGSFRLHAEGSGAPGTIGADVHVTLADGPDGGTDLTYDADSIVGGAIGGVGQRMLAGVSKRMAAQFFANVDAVLGTPSGPDLTGEAGRTGGGGAVVAGSGGRPSEERARPDGPAAPPSTGRPADIGQVFTNPAVSTSSTGGGFARGVLVGAAAALAGVLVGGWIGRRRR